MISELFPDFRQLQNTGFAGITCTKPTVMIAMTPRTGSTHLCDALQAAGDIGCPRESFNPRGFIGEEKALRRVERFEDYIRSFSEQPGQVFLFKTCWHDFAPLAPGLRTIFPLLHVVYLDRKDVIAQAVSLFRAEISGEWARAPGQPAPSPDDLRDRFDLARIGAIVENLIAEKHDWERFFASQAITPARLFYETFAGDISPAIRFFAEHTDIILRRDIAPQAGFEKLADTLSDAWVNQVRRHVFQMT